jgi:hypothetical protein
MVTTSEAAHHVQNMHHDPAYACPTGEIGVLGGATFLNLDAMLFWIVCLMLVCNVREDYFDEHGRGADNASVGGGVEEK